MPELPILDSEGKLSSVAPIIVTAIMAHPDDEKARAEFAANNLVHLLTVIAGEGTIPVTSLGFLVPVLSAAPSAGAVLQRTMLAVANSWVATTTLALMLSAAENHPDQKIDASRAFWIIESTSPGAPTNRTKQKLWQQFRPVAHLDLAIGPLLLAHGITPPAPGDPPPLNFTQFLFANFVEFLGLAESIRRSAVAHRFIAHEELWWAPPSLSLPTFSVSLPPLTDEQLAALATYKPPHAR